MGGSTKKVDVTPQQTKDVRTQLIDYLMGGGQGGANGGTFGGLNRIQAGQGYQPGTVNVGQAAPVQTQFDAGRQIDQSMIPSVGTQFNAGDVQTRFRGGGVGPQAQTQFGTGVGPFQRGAVRDVNAPGGPAGVQTQFGPTVGAPQAARDVTAGQTQSIDQLGGAGSPFMQNILAQTQPLFDQQRNLALAQAKEQSGNLTGSGYANALGNSLGRLVPQQQAQLAAFAAQATAQEQARQQVDATRSLQAQGMNQGADQALMNQLLQYGQLGQGAQALGLQGQQANQQAGLAQGAQGLQAQLANQGADQSFLQQLLGQGGLNLQAAGLGLQGQQANQAAFQNAAGRGLQAQQMGLQGQLANQAQGLQAQQLGLQAQGMNQSAAQNFINQLLQQNSQGLQAQQLGLQGQLANQGNAQQGFNLQAQLEAARQGQMGSLDQQRQLQNASIIAQLLGQQGIAGVAPSEIVKSGGIGALLGPIASGIGGFIGSGGNPLGAIGGLLGGGGGGGGGGSYQFMPPSISMPLPSNFPTYQLPY